MNNPFGAFSEEALATYQEALAEKEGFDFSEGDLYDFTRCVRPDGKAYGTRGKCRKGTETAKGTGTAKDKSIRTPHQIANRINREWSDASVKLNKKDNSAKITYVNRGPISSDRWVDSHLQANGQEHGRKHDKTESFVDKSGNKHTITPLLRDGELRGHTIEITPPSA